MPYVKKGDRVVLADEKQLEQLALDGWERCEAPEGAEEAPQPRGRLFEPKPTQHKLFRDGKSILVDSKQLQTFQDLGWSLDGAPEEEPAEEPEPGEEPVEEDEDLRDLESLEPEEDEE
jgi:hypothetical protein